MHYSLATGSIAAVPLIQFLNAQQILDKIYIPEPHEEITEIYSALVDTNRIVKTNTNSASILGEVTKEGILISFGYPYKIGNISNHSNAINIHFGSLPENRGPDPLFWSLKRGKKIAYITIHKISNSFDKGKIVSQKGHPIYPGEHYGLLYSKLGSLVIPMIEELIKNGIQTGQEQNEDLANYYPKPNPKDLMIDWTNNAEIIENLVMACNPRYNGAQTTMNGIPIRVFEVNQIDPSHFQNLEEKPSGQVVMSSQEGVFVKCGEKEVLRLNIIGINEGFVTGTKFAAMGINESVRFL